MPAKLTIYGLSYSVFFSISFDVPNELLFLNQIKLLRSGF